jgi:hypothetical protein
VGERWGVDGAFEKWEGGSSGSSDSSSRSVAVADLVAEGNSGSDVEKCSGEEGGSGSDVGKRSGEEGGSGSDVGKRSGAEGQCEVESEDQFQRKLNTDK